jgi:hypothetical protein
MTVSMCPSLHRLSSLLRAAYRLRDNCPNDTKSKARAERDLYRVHRIISLHRTLCPSCKFNEQALSLPSQGGHSFFNGTNVNNNGPDMLDEPDSLRGL